MPEARRASRSSSCWSSPIRIRPPGRRSPNARTAPTCCRSARSYETSGSRTASNRSIQWGEQIVKPIFEIEGRQRGHVSPGQEARLRRPDVQEHQGREQRAGRRGHAARDQPRRLVDRLLRPVAGAPEGAHGEPEESSTCVTLRAKATGPKSRATITACRGRAGARRRSSIPARTRSTTPTFTSRTAAARSARASASSARRSMPDGSRSRERQPARRRLLLQGLGDQGRLSRVHLRRAEEARLGQGSRPRPNSRRSTRSAATIRTACRWAIDLSGGIQRVAHRARL